MLDEAHQRHPVWTHATVPLKRDNYRCHPQTRSTSEIEIALAKVTMAESTGPGGGNHPEGSVIDAMARLPANEVNLSPLKPGRLRVPHSENSLGKQIAATALLSLLTVLTRNTAHYEPTGVPLINPFT